MNKKGFTLVELLAVLTIIAVLMVISVPNVLKIGNTMRDKGLKAKEEALEVAATSFAKNNSNRIKRNIGNTNYTENGKNYYVCAITIPKMIEYGAYEAEESTKDNNCQILNPNDNTCLYGYVKIKLNEKYSNSDTEFVRKDEANQNNTDGLTPCLDY